MDRGRVRRILAGFLVALSVASTPLQARPGLLGALNSARAEGCGGAHGVSPPLRANKQLDNVARRIARGENLRTALSAVGYRALHSSSMFLSNAGKDADIARSLARRSCSELRDVAVRDIGIERRGQNVWIVLAAPFGAPELADTREVSERILDLANEARSRARRCGSKSFTAARPLRLAKSLTEAAREQARDMARHSDLTHEGSDGSTPAQRVTRAGYAWRTVGENVASGPTTAEEVMSGWLASPGHCENLMDPRFTEMGIAWTVDAKSASGVYWSQVFATPREAR